ncbi:hypothetical protein ZIOFF_068015 [Zingiber officinale]|uniref:Uncharacterized protein n=2 Tax=Zingiber officinale TaxID=94328 RepID=A0A8J5EVJ8_ZINOF|nr:hypothetical protein ZIOFF_068015 [Zingiber officinale]
MLLLAAAVVCLMVVAVEHDVTVATPPDAQLKCACDSCGCTQSPPPPPPPPIWSEPYYCPPPPAPPAPYFYIVGSPANLYPYDSSFEPSSASRSSYAGAAPVVVLGVAWAFALVIN